MVNCPGNMPAAGVRRIEKFVRAGGLLYTTDWALLNVIQKAFPNTIAHNGVSTADHVTAVHVHKKDDNLMSNMLLREKQEPQWWLEGGSYPIKILDPKRVQVLASSPEMKRRYSAAPVVVRFRWDDGEVIHVVSHFYRQISTRGPAVAAKDAIDGVQGLTDAQKKKFKKNAGAGAKMGDVESSYAFQADDRQHRRWQEEAEQVARPSIQMDRFEEAEAREPTAEKGRPAEGRVEKGPQGEGSRRPR